MGDIKSDYVDSTSDEWKTKFDHISLIRYCSVFPLHILIWFIRCCFYRPYRLHFNI